ncbi:FIG020313: hypothetical protein [hydrothermal vent metagenome]|uniref:Mth938-like domain-containing protein n=1 Tax=hydrothermal vent metagenome TaxID=652676 RepID=A0A3B0TMR8_9ZZZZ
MQRDGYYPYQTLVDAYGNGGFRFADMSHKGSLLCLPSGMHAWPVSAIGQLNMESFAPVFAVADKIDVLMVGMGVQVAYFDPELRRAFKQRNIIVEAIGTGSAISTYNILFAEKRAVAAALIAVTDAGAR